MTMRPLLALAAAVLALAAAGPAAAAPAAPRQSATYYLALGDSLSVGVQPDVAGKNRRTPFGYAPQLYASLVQREPSLRLYYLGCPGETTTSMVKGGVCHYPHRTQLAQAESFLRAHRDSTSLVTIDIGANDVDSCGVTDTGCFLAALPALEQNMTAILSGLRAAGGSSLKIVAMNYYDPYLALYLLGGDNQAAALGSAALLGQLNTIQTAYYTRYGVPVADVAAAFSSTVTTPVPVPGLGGSLPLDVAAICQLTYMCRPAPVGPNIHADDAGYGAIAKAFAAVLTR